MSDAAAPAAPTPSYEDAAVSATEAAPEAPTAAPVAAAPQVTHGAAKSASLEQALAAAGLMMATTDPAKLRKVQEAAESHVPAPRVPRERKPMPSLSAEPLVQIETRS